MSLYTITIPADDELVCWSSDAEPDSGSEHWFTTYYGPCTVVLADDERYSLEDLYYYGSEISDWIHTLDGDAAIKWDDVPEGWLTHGAL